MDYKERVSEIFSGTLLTDQQINDAIQYVLEDENELTEDQRLEGIINMLLETASSPSFASQSEFLDDSPSASASGVKRNNAILISQYFDQIKELFPDICPNYLLEFCQRYDYFEFSTVVNDLTQQGYKKVEQDPLDIWEHLRQMLPDADPTYLRNQARVLVRRPAGELEEFISNAIEKPNYPTMSDYLISKQHADDMEMYLKTFSPATFLEKVPNPLGLYLKSDFKSALTQKVVDSNDVQFALDFLNNQFVYLRKKEIESIFHGYNRHLIKTCNKLRTLPKSFRNPREMTTDLDVICKNVPLLQEISFLKHEREIRQFIKQKDDKYRIALDEARLHGLLQTCGCCFDEQLIPEECFFCMNGCIFCRDCVRIGAETVIGEGKLNFPCLADCGDEFHLQTLQMVLDKKVFQRLCQRRQVEEIKKANIEGLETCPFCDFCTIPPEDSKVFKCLNTDCMKESCRECRHVSHIPLRCSEIEYDEDVKLRTYIEDKMTEALVRTCPGCSRKFLKDSGCNKMTCPHCRTLMCYICGKQIQDYSHFNPGGCPLHTENLTQLHLDNVIRGAARAKADLGVDLDPKKLKFDPTRGLSA